MCKQLTKLGDYRLYHDPQRRLPFFARDAKGVEVPGSGSVSDGDLLSFVEHYRALFDVPEATTIDVRKVWM